MKRKLLSVIMCVAIIMSMLVVWSVAADEPDLTLDFNKRYTDILEYDEVDDPYLDLDKNSEEKQQKRNIYVVVLVVLLVIAVIVFVYTLRKVPDEKNLNIDNKKQKLKAPEEEHSTTLADEEKTE